MLAKILLKQQRISWRPDEVRNSSVRRFNSFQLIKSTRTEKSLGSPGGWWLECSVEIAGNTCRIEIHHLEQTLTPKELAGFNNTGNICIWPSEEVLTYYLLSNLQLFEGKLVLEVGGGMTCLAGLFLASYGNVKRVDLTDGNKKSVDNVQRIIKRNKLEASKVRSFHLDWVDRRQVTKPYDIVLSSDCLFFDETRVNLVDTIWELLKEDGMALVIAPRRGDTLNSFIKIAYKKGFKCLLKNRYDETIWQKHLSFKDSHMEYDEDLHYPSIQFHENGKKHKENVSKRLTDMQKKAAKEAKDAVKFDNEMKRIEAAALKAYASDVMSNADFTSRLIRSGLETLPEPETVLPDPVQTQKPKPKITQKTHQNSGQKWSPVKKWRGRAPEENVDTGEYHGVPSEHRNPTIGEKKAYKSDASGAKNFHKKKLKTNNKKLPNSVEHSQAREDKAIEFGPVFQSPTYGAWEKVQIEAQEPVDLQLPEQELIPISVPKLREESERRFKEKVFVPGSFAFTQEGESFFKKRKITQCTKKNMRRRLSDS
ncbi:hypothetical protein RUM44_011847 [Polyplax serrata]|uniref:Calmodulin-lysine N-methyltransferase n=1 Tax=Polyplax serrata TaxID=468196 RepID=A0ABR1BDJ6_POLSC